MQFSILTLIALSAATAQAAFAGNLVKSIFGREEFEEVVLKARDATEAEWVGKIQHWYQPEPIGMSATVKGILMKAGCSPPARTKAQRSLETEVSDQHLILIRSPATIVKKADAMAAAGNPSALPPTIKMAFTKAGWTGTCTTGVKARGLESEVDEFDLYARGFDEEFEHDY